MAAHDLTALLATMDQRATSARARIAQAQIRLANAERHSADVRELLGEGIDGVPLSLAPLHAALLGAIAGNAAMFFGYVEWLTRCRDLPWNAAMIISVLAGVGSLPFSSKPGAGGSARRGLRIFTMVGLLLGSLGVLRMFVA